MKTVYILGAGFSKEAGAPNQTEIMNCIFSKKDNDNLKNPDHQYFKDFLVKQMNFDESQFKLIQLEDIFTPLDRCLSDNINFRGLGITEIMKIRESVFNLIGLAIKDELNKHSNKKHYIDIFADYLVNLSAERINNRRKNKDPVSVISTNWDILLDNSIHNSIQKNYIGTAVVDYCCYISSLDPHDDTVQPGLKMLGSGGFNVKLLKLHGSLNWLQCPRCMRIYTGFSEKFATQKNKRCRHCDNNFPEENGHHKLVSNLIMPTFIKDLSNPQYKIIWQNAGIEISEADELIFIGYSLPNADFEMRQLLSRMTKRNAKIKVVDYIKDIHSPEGIIEQNKVAIRWKGFFGKRNIIFYFDGASKFLINEHYLPSLENT
ncbi:hypothetical protein SJI19_23715 [Acerihabitans sp. TG2]|uniref:hypothetical protein n=1 Tax=Acerihabitans sp. TG2 TaxID=3096008 RepID=UPI002B227E45|nr:hypothetical protein [Acerihabitans sp. TG2]MEA9393499.1 hypothetical protein [Acerihabitans sp. TG2]